MRFFRRGRGVHTGQIITEPFTTEPGSEPMTTTTDPETTGSHQLEDTRPMCRECRGTGRVLNTADWLTESLGLFPTGDPVAMDGIIAEFYKRLISFDDMKADGDKLASLFPADLTTGEALNSKGHRQRDVLLDGVLTLMSTYDPDHLDSEPMQHLVQVLRKLGRDHAAFQRPDGTVRGATVKEYGEVLSVLVGLIHDAFGDRWLPEYDRAWADAYWFAAVEMMHSAQHHRTASGSVPVVGRQARAAK